MFDPFKLCGALQDLGALSLMTSRCTSPDDVEEVGTVLGLSYQIVKCGSRPRCGYVRLPDGHFLNSAGVNDYDACGFLDVHGGVTWVHKRLPYQADSEAGAQMWLGFDCGHVGLGDLDTERSRDFVREQCAKLAQQILGGM